jgi:hypothetical protein
MLKLGVASSRELSLAVLQQHWALPRAFRGDTSLDGTKKTFSGFSVYFNDQLLDRSF